MKFNIKISILLAVLLQSCWGDKGVPNYEYMPNMYESLSYEAYSESQIFEDELSARLPVEGTIPRGYSLYEYEDTNEGYDLAKKELSNPFSFAQKDILEAKELYTRPLWYMSRSERCRAGNFSQKRKNPRGS